MMVATYLPRSDTLSFFPLQAAKISDIALHKTRKKSLWH